MSKLQDINTAAVEKEKEFNNEIIGNIYSDKIPNSVGDSKIKKKEFFGVETTNNLSCIHYHVGKDNSQKFQDDSQNLNEKLDKIQQLLLTRELSSIELHFHFKTFENIRFTYSQASDSIQSNRIGDYDEKAFNEDKEINFTMSNNRDTESIVETGKHYGLENLGNTCYM